LMWQKSSCGLTSPYDLSELARSIQSLLSEVVMI